MPIKVRNVVCDYYLDYVNEYNSKKYGESRLGDVVPILRVFGIHEPTGQKCCTHIHGFFPYLIIRTGTRLTQKLKDYLYAIISSIIEHDVSILPENQTIQSDDNTPIFDIYEERGRSIYGFYEKEDWFLRLVFNDPTISKIVTASFQTRVSECEFLQPYDAHIPFLLQFFIDFSLSGMDLIEFKRADFRKLPIEAETLNEHSITSPLKPCSRCAIEFDVFTDDIFVNSGGLAEYYDNPGLEFIWREEVQRCSLRGESIQNLLKAEEQEKKERTNDEVQCFLQSDEDEALKSRCEIIDVLQKISSLGKHSLAFIDEDSIRMDNVEEAFSRTAAELSALQKSQLPDNYFRTNEFLEMNDDVHDRTTPQPMDAAWQRCEYELLGYDVADEEADAEEGECDDFASESCAAPTSDEYSVKGEDGELLNSEVGTQSSFEEDEENFDFESLLYTFDDSDSTLDEFGEPEKRKKRGKVLLETASSIPLTVRDPNEPVDVITIDDDGDNQKDKEAPVICEYCSLPQKETTTDNCKNPNEIWCIDTPFRRKNVRINGEEMRNQCAVDSRASSSTLNFERELMALSSTVNNLCVLSLEVLALPLQSKKPIAEPEQDRILAVFIAFNTDICNNTNNSSDRRLFKKAAIIQRELYSREIRKLFGTSRILFVNDEFDLFTEIAKLVQRLDPDILLGYNTKRWSWGYLFERAKHLKIPFSSNISRICSKEMPKELPQHFKHPLGRLLIEVWWQIRRERPLRSYSFSSVVMDVLRKRVPLITEEEVTAIFSQFRTRPINHVILNHQMTKACLNIALLNEIDFFVRTSEMARVYGIQFESVITRGSQFRVESMLLRLCKQNRLFAPSVSVQQRTKMPSPLTIPLNIEPESDLYYEPLAVLDFQSLYPSICIAHNYCFTTCIGKIANFKAFLAQLEANENNGDGFTADSQPKMTIGAIPYYIESISRLEELVEAGDVTISPVGGVFVKSHIRQGVLGKLLTQLLDTRIMVKRAMKGYKNYKKIYRLLDARQLALKLIANVTYGYTAANWSGRMPCEEVADAIVSKGRETLQRVINSVNDASEGDKYAGSRVIYGDTDSLFVLFENSDFADSFAIAEEIAKDATLGNPYPIKLKLEKIMLPSVLVTKKRYAGWSYESSNDGGALCAKGLEAIRRDSPLFVSRTMEMMLKLIFTESITSALHYLRSKLARVDRIPPTEFAISCDYRGGYAEDANVPGKKLAAELQLKSSRMAPKYGERLSYIITQRRLDSYDYSEFPSTSSQEPQNLISCVLSLEDFARNPHLRIDYNYYVRRQLIPPISRLLKHCPVRIGWHVLNCQDCLGCNASNRYPWCSKCSQSPRNLQLTLPRQVQNQRVQLAIDSICRRCISPRKSLCVGGGSGRICENFACEHKGRLMALERDPYILGDLEEEPFQF